MPNPGRRSWLSPGLAAAAAALVVAGSTLVALPHAAAAGPSIEQDLSTFRIVTALRLAFLEHFKADGLHIGIDVRGGAVTLSGTVKHRTTQELAEEVALSVSGVKDVDNTIVLAPQDTSEPAVARALGKAERKTDDAILESRVKLKLIDNIGMKAFKVEVEAVNGTVSLRGTLPTDSQRDTAISSARATSGVEKVIDLIKVR